MYAVIKTGGKQYQIKEGDELLIEKLPNDKGDEIKFDQVLLVKTDEGVNIGKPFLNDWSVSAEVLDQVKGDKLHVYKFRSKSRYRRKYGHRQHFTKVEINEITKLKNKSKSKKDKNGKD
jgi:large subunit ribosomal protein L21